MKKAKIISLYNGDSYILEYDASGVYSENAYRFTSKNDVVTYVPIEGTIVLLDYQGNADNRIK